ncbi:hypothetical protein V8C86DRAFT_2516364 [Haematococcus lacustris]
MLPTRLEQEMDPASPQRLATLLAGQTAWLLPALSQLACPVCQDWVVPSCVLTCGHTLCTTCATRWLSRQQSCPVCRTALAGLPLNCQPLDAFVYELLGAVQRAPPSAPAYSDPWAPTQCLSTPTHHSTPQRHRPCPGAATVCQLLSRSPDDPAGVAAQHSSDPDPVAACPSALPTHRPGRQHSFRPRCGIQQCEVAGGGSCSPHECPSSQTSDAPILPLPASPPPLLFRRSESDLAAAADGGRGGSRSKGGRALGAAKATGCSQPPAIQVPRAAERQQGGTSTANWLSPADRLPLLSRPLAAIAAGLAERPSLASSEVIRGPRAGHSHDGSSSSSDGSVVQVDLSSPATSCVISSGGSLAGSSGVVHQASWVSVPRQAFLLQPEQASCATLPPAPPPVPPQRAPARAHTSRPSQPMPPPMEPLQSSPPPPDPPQSAPPDPPPLGPLPEGCLAACWPPHQGEQRVRGRLPTPAAAAASRQALRQQLRGLGWQPAGLGPQGEPSYLAADPQASRWLRPSPLPAALASL